MPRVYLLILIAFNSHYLVAQNAMIYLSSAQDVYLAGDTIKCSLSQLSSKAGKSAVLLDFFDSRGEKIDNYYTSVGATSTKKFAFVTQGITKSGWYYIKGSTADGTIQSNTIRLFILNKEDNLLKLPDIVSDNFILIFTEGSYPLIYTLPGVIYIKVNNNIAAYNESVIVLKDSQGNKLAEQRPDQDGFVKMELIPDPNDSYYVEFVKEGNVISSKQIDKEIFSDNGISLNLNYESNHIVNIQLGTLSKTILSAVVKMVAYNKTIETLFLGSANEFSLDLSNYPSGMLKLEIIDQRSNILQERLIFNKSQRKESLLDSYINIAPTVQRGDSVTLNFDLSKMGVHHSKIKSAVLSIQDHGQNLFSGYSNTSKEANLNSLKYYFSELPQKLNDRNRSSKSLDHYFAINQYSSYQGGSEKNESGDLAGQNLILQGRLTDANHVALSSTPMVLTIPAEHDSFRWTNTDDFGNFSFTNLNYTGNKNIFLTPIFTDSLKTYIIKINNPLGKKYYNGYQNHMATDKWLTLNRSLELSKNIKFSYSDKNVSEEVINHSIISDKTILLFENVDYDIDLNDYELPEQMTKFINPIIPGVNVRKGKLRIFSTEFGKSFSKDPLLLIDGIPYFNIDSLLMIDPVRFNRVQVITTINKLAPFGNLGSSGVLAFYTKEGYELIDEYPSLLNLNGYRNYKLPDKYKSIAKDNTTPYLPSSYVYNIYHKDELSTKISLVFKAPDITTTLNVKLLLITEAGVSIINKTVHVEK